MSTSKLVFGAAGLAAAFGLGFFLGGQSHRERGAITLERGAMAEPAARPKTAQGSVPAAVRVATVPSASSARAIDARRNFTAREELQVLLDLRQRKLIEPEPKLMSGRAKITEQFVELFALTPGEQDVLQRSLDAARAQLEAIELQNMTVTRAPNGEVTIAVKPFPEAGGAVYDALLKTFADTLGPERNEAFVAFGSERVENRLGSFGATQYVTTYSKETKDGEVRYRIHSKSGTTPDDTSIYHSDWLTYDDFVRREGSWVKLLPPDFAPPR